MGVQPCRESSYLRIRAIILHEGIRNFDALLSIPRRYRGIDIGKLVDGQIRIEFVRLLELLELLEMIDPGGSGGHLERPRQGDDVLGLMALSEEWRHHDD